MRNRLSAHTARPSIEPSCLRAAPDCLRAEDFRAYFKQFGVISDAVVMYDHATQRPRGFGFVTYESHEAVDEVFKLGAIHTLGEKRVECKRAVPKEHMPGGGGVSGMRGGRSNSRGSGSSGLGGGGGDGGIFSGGYAGSYAALERSMGALSFGPGNGVAAYHGTHGAYSGAVGQHITNMGAHGYPPGTFATAAAYGAHPHYTTGGIMGSPVGYGGLGYADGYGAGSPGYGAGSPLYAATHATGSSGLDGSMQTYAGHDAPPMVLSPTTITPYGMQMAASQSSLPLQKPQGATTYDEKKLSPSQEPEPRRDGGPRSQGGAGSSDAETKEARVSREQQSPDGGDGIQVTGASKLIMDPTQLKSVSYSNALSLGAQQQQQQQQNSGDPQVPQASNAIGDIGDEQLNGSSSYRPYFPYV